MKVKFKVPGWPVQLRRVERELSSRESVSSMVGLSFILSEEDRCRAVSRTERVGLV